MTDWPYYITSIIHTFQSTIISLCSVSAFDAPDNKVYCKRCYKENVGAGETLLVYILTWLHLIKFRFQLITDKIHKSQNCWLNYNVCCCSNYIRSLFFVKYRVGFILFPWNFVKFGLSYFYFFSKNSQHLGKITIISFLFVNFGLNNEVVLLLRFNHHC